MLVITFQIIFLPTRPMLRPLPALRALMCALSFFAATAAAADLDGLAKLTWLKIDSPHFSVGPMGARRIRVAA